MKRIKYGSIFWSVADEETDGCPDHQNGKKDGHKTYLLTESGMEEESTVAYLNGTISRTTARASAKSFQT